MDIEETAAILNFYSERSQGGNGMNYFYTPYSMQRGTGVGSFLSGMVRPLIPIAKKGVMYLAPHLMKILRELAGDLIENPSNIKSSIKKRREILGCGVMALMSLKARCWSARGPGFDSR